ncbi:MAG: DUF835 domain-containing protein [Thermoplasmata archaeon]
MEIAYFVYGTIFLLTAIATIYVAHRGYWSDPKGRKNKLFLFMAISMIIWLLGETGFWFSEKMEMVLAFYHFKYLGIIFIAPAFFFVANAVPIWRNILNKRWVYWLLLLPPIIFVILCLTNPFTNLFFSNYFEEPMAKGKYGGKWSTIWWFYAIFEYSLILCAILLLLLSKKQARTKIEKDQARILVLAALLPLLTNMGNVGISVLLDISLVPDPTPFAMAVSTILLGYAISKYKLLSITPETERRTEERVLPFVVEHGYNYVIVDNHTNAPYFLLRTLSTEKPGLCITGRPPLAVRSAFKIERLPIIWITEVETPEQSVRPERLDFELAQSIINFMRENPGSTVLLDDIEYLSTKCGFDAVTNFLKDIVDVASTTNSTFIVQVRPAFFEDEKVRILTAMFDKELKLPEIAGEKVMARTFLYYRKEDSLEKIASRIPPGEKVLVITRTHPRKVEKYFGKADYFWITDLELKDVKTIRPEEVDTTFILAIKEGINAGVKHIVIDGCDVVKMRVDFTKYLGFIKDLTDLAHKHNVNLYCVAERSDEKENVVVSTRFDVTV